MKLFGEGGARTSVTERGGVLAGLHSRVLTRLSRSSRFELTQPQS